MYEIALGENSIVESGNDIMYAINIPQESVTIPETIDAVRAACRMQLRGHGWLYLYGNHHGLMRLRR